MNSCKQPTTNQPPTIAATAAGTPTQTKPESTYDQNTADAIVPTDKICYASDDGLVRIDQLVFQTEKYPPSPYPCVVLVLNPDAHTRVREIHGGYIEYMPSFREMEELVIAMNNVAKASGKGQLYQILQTVPEKTKQHKEKWRRYNEERLGLRPKPGKWWPKQYSKPGKN